jgi:plastocyanin
MKHFFHLPSFRSLLPLLATAVTVGQAAGQMPGPGQAGRPYPSAAGMPYAGSMSPGAYGGSYGSRQGNGYGSDYGYGAMGAGVASASYTMQPPPSPEERRMSRLLTASGVPNDDGRPRWPLGLRILAGPVTGELRDQIDALFQLAADQAAGGPVNAALARETGQAVKQLRGVLLRDKAERFGMPLAVYEDAERFLNRLDRAGHVLAAGLEAAGSEARLTTAAPPTSDTPPPAPQGARAAVGMHDNYFQPMTLTVPVGATVVWTNQGRHRHSVTSDDGTWGSKDVVPKGAHGHTFTRPGTYPYRCAVHPHEMRGTVIVK